jgi:hypothetical protein
MYDKFGVFYANNLQSVGRAISEKNAQTDKIAAGDEFIRASEESTDAQEIAILDEKITAARESINNTESDIKYLETIRDQYIGTMSTNEIAENLYTMSA